MSSSIRSGVKLGVAHELGLAGACTAALLIVLVGGELPAFAWLGLGAPWVSVALKLSGRTTPAASGTLLGLASLALAGGTLANGGIEASVLAFGELLLGLLCARVLVRRTPAHDLQTALLALLLVLAASVLNVGLSYLWLFVTFAVLLVWALATRQLLAAAPADSTLRENVRRQRTDVVTPAFFGATGALSLAVLAFAAAVFVLFPRVGFGDLGAFLRKESTLPSAVGLRGDPRALGGTKVVARVWGVDPERFAKGLYLRGAVYDQLTLEGFSQDRSGDERLGRAAGLALTAAEPQRYELTVMPMVGDTLPTLGGVDALRPLSGGTANPNFTLGVLGRTPRDELKANDTVLSAFRYEVTGSIAGPGEEGAPVDDAPPLDPSSPRDARWLQLPADLDPALARLADEVAGPSGDLREQAGAIRRFLLEQFRYSQQPPRFARAPLRAFLLEDRQGHCEYFAAAHALLLRARGIGARVVGGFQGGAWDDGWVVFEERHAHAWVEWYLPGHGWVVDDGTPLATAPREQLSGLSAFVEALRRQWDDRVLDYSIGDQSEALQRARSAVGRLDLPVKRALVAVLVLGALTALVILWRRRRRRDPAAAVHPLARALLDASTARLRGPVPPDRTVREAVTGALAELEAGDAPRGAPGDALAHALRHALAVYEQDRFGAREVDADAVRAAQRRLRRASEEARRARPPRPTAKKDRPGATPR